MYYSEGVGSWDNVFLRPFYLTITIGLTIAAVILMLTTYYHLLPKNVAFFLFSAPPVNVSIYVLMAIVYAQVPANTITLTAAIIFFVIIFTILKGIQFLESRASSPEGLELGPKETIKEKFLGKLKEKNIELQKKKEKAE